MPQQERSRNQIEMLKWLRNQKTGATTAALKAYTRNEITLLGATDKTIESYIDNLKNAGLIEYKHPFWQITNSGSNFLGMEIDDSGAIPALSWFADKDVICLFDFSLERSSYAVGSCY